jgi:methylenetetrahydrofolate dehydrogenase (NADP+)/methenyltetrahydrofolate cyclohydrolase
MKLLEGKKIADEIFRDIKEIIKIQRLKPGLAVILVGQNEASEIYVRLKQKAAEEVGINFFLHRFPEESDEKEIIEKIQELNNDEKISGMIVQLPLPKNLNTQKIMDAIASEKDADGFSAQSEFPPVFPNAILQLIKSSGQNLSDKSAIVIANSTEFGETMSGILEKGKINSQYILAENIERELILIKNADIIITAVGKPKLISGNMIKKDAIVIDGGISKIGEKVVGDVDFESMKNVAGFLSPVPGGVGPVTIACLLENVYQLSIK